MNDTRKRDAQDCADLAKLVAKLGQQSVYARKRACTGPPPRRVCDLGQALYDCYALRLARARLWTPCFRITRIAGPKGVRHAIQPKPISRLSAFDLRRHPRRQTMGQSLANFRFVNIDGNVPPSKAQNLGDRPDSEVAKNAGAERQYHSRSD